MRKPRTAIERALGLLAVRDRGEGELRQRLSRAGFPEPEVEGTLERLKAMGYLDDARFARARAEAFARTGRYGERAIAQKLASTGIGLTEARAAARLAVASGEGGEVGAVRRLIARRGLKTTTPDDAARAFRFLLGRGFSSEAVSRALRVEADTET